MKLNSHAGHGRQDSKSCGAVDIIKESVEDRLVNDTFVKLGREDGNTVFDCTVDYPNSQQDCLNKIVEKCNANWVDLDVSHHFNSGRDDDLGDGSIGGVEVYVYSANDPTYEIGKRVCANIEKLGFKNRGVKVKPEYFYLRKTKNKAMIIEYLFVDDKDDCNLYKKVGHEALAKAALEGILNKKLDKKVYKNCVLYGNEIDKVGAEIIGWNKEDCIVKSVKDHTAWEAENLFTVGGQAKSELDKMNTKEKYTSIVGLDRYDTIKNCLSFVGK